MISHLQNNGFDVVFSCTICLWLLQLIFLGKQDVVVSQSYSHVENISSCLGNQLYVHSWSTTVCNCHYSCYDLYMYHYCIKNVKGKANEISIQYKQTQLLIMLWRKVPNLS